MNDKQAFRRNKVSNVIGFYAALALAVFGIERQDRFEVIVISINWLVLIINGILLSVFFNRRFKGDKYGLYGNQGQRRAPPKIRA